MRRSRRSCRRVSRSPIIPAHLIAPGFIDTHIHYVQTGIIGAQGKQLLDWLNDYTFIAEQAFADEAVARDTARVFCDELAAQRHDDRAGVLLGPCRIGRCAVRGGGAPQSAAHRRQGADGPRGAAGAHGYRALGLRPVEGADRASGTAAAARSTPSRRALRSPARPSNSELAGACGASIPDVFVQTHIAENLAEIARVRELFPQRRDYLDVYAHYGLTGRRAVLAHGVHFGESEFARCHESGTAVVALPDLEHVPRQRPVRDARGARSAPAGACRPRHRHRRRHELLAARHHGRGLQGRAAARPSRSTRSRRSISRRSAARARSRSTTSIGTLAPGREADMVVLDPQGHAAARVPQRARAFDRRDCSPCWRRSATTGRCARPMWRASLAHARAAVDP